MGDPSSLFRLSFNFKVDAEFLTHERGALSQTWYTHDSVQQVKFPFEIGGGQIKVGKGDTLGFSSTESCCCCCCCLHSHPFLQLLFLLSVINTVICKNLSLFSIAVVINECIGNIYEVTLPLLH